MVLLRSGYLIFCQGSAGDEGVSYMDLPPLMWRTRTGNGNVYVINTGLFRESKALLGAADGLSQPEGQLGSVSGHQRKDGEPEGLSAACGGKHGC